MKITIIKHSGGFLSPASDIEAERLVKFKNNSEYEIDIKLSRHSGFHRKVFRFMNYCFVHWSSDKEFMNESAQFDCFRQNLTVLAGYYDELYTISGSQMRIQAKSLSYGSMSQDEFESFYSALIRAAMRHIFNGCDKEVEKKLTSFF